MTIADQVITVDQIMACRPRYRENDYPRERIVDLLGGEGQTTTLAAIARMSIPAGHRVWLLCHLGPPGLVARFARRCASAASCYAVDNDAASYYADVAAEAATEAEIAEIAGIPPVGGYAIEAASSAEDAAAITGADADAEREAQCAWWVSWCGVMP